ncbi:MAG TPA: YHYH protein [bacterium]|nr:YHYH protein [bacterium]
MSNKTLTWLIFVILISASATAVVYFIFFAEKPVSVKQNSDSEETTDISTILESGLLPLGNDKYSTTAKTGYIYSCQTSFNGGGAFNTGEWIDEINGTWDPKGKPIVDGDVPWDNATVSFELQGLNRNVSGNGLPTNHNTGTYPIQTTDDAYDYDRNPNTISAQEIGLELNSDPQIANSPNCLSMGMIAITLNGVAVFNAFDAAGRDAPAYEILDKCDGHPESSGQYHYHNYSKCLEDSTGSNQHSSIIGYALDGFGFFGLKGEDGTQVTNDDLDECHGHTHQVEWDGDEESIYHYHVTEEFPYTIGCFKGTPVQTGQAVPGLPM